ncbi:MAG: WbqC family protein [Chitinophagales bacterium]|jgi:hypothetical protein|nr:WbqC family protein [Chitinophagales bacterium]
MTANSKDTSCIIAIHQPNYIPWLGYFYKIAHSDTFVFLDNVQFPKESPAARNYIKGKTGEKVLLSVSVKKSKGAFQNYNELELDYSTKWHLKHLNQIKDAYFKAPYFKEFYPELEKLYLEPASNLAAFNTKIILWILNQLNIHTTIKIASHFDDGSLGTQNERNLNICLHFKANKYLSGTGARKYNQEDVFIKKNIELIYSDYTPQEYTQINGPFVANLSIIDTLFNVGKEGTRKMILGH